MQCCPCRRTRPRIGRPVEAPARSIPQHAAAFFHPVQRRIGEYGVEWILESEPGRVGQDERERGIILPRLAKHFFGIVQAHHLSAAFCDLRGQLPGAAANIQNPLAAAWLQQFQETRSELPNVGVLAFVALRVPGRNSRSFAARFDFLGGLDRVLGLRPEDLRRPPARIADKTSLNSSCFFRSFFDGGACSCR